MTDSAATLVVSVPDARLASALVPLPTGVELVEWSMQGPAPRERIDLVVGPYMSLGPSLPALEGVQTRLVQGQSIGYDDVTGALPAGHRFANAASVHETATAELALALILAAQRQLPRFVRAQAERRWAPVFAQSLADRRVLVLGYGGVGKATVSRLAAFETTITVVASRARAENDRDVHSIDELPALLPNADIVVVTLPASDATHRLIGADALAALPDGALVVNVGRGPVIDTDALVAEVRTGRLRAALDVTDPEPLPADHPLWTLPGVLISPHVGGAASAMQPRVIRLIRTQIDRMLAGEEPLNIVIEPS